MQIPILNLPKLVPSMRERAPQDTIPQTKYERERIKLWCAQYVEQERPTPPLSFEELRKASTPTRSSRSTRWTRSTGTTWR
jgi:geranylgeranyl diphosphate synthase, type II